MEVAGFVLGVASAVGFLGQVFDGCVKAYSIYTTATNLGQDSERYVTRIRIEEARLCVWGEAWGVIEGKLEENLTAEKGPYQKGLRAVAELILTQLYETIMDLNKLQERYGLREQTPGSVDKEAYKKSSASPKILLANVTGGAKLKLRARWVIADKEKFAQFLDDLKYFNDRLIELFPPDRAVTVQRAWTNNLVQKADKMEDLRLLESASSGGVYPGLEAFVQLKQLHINLDAQEPSKKILSSSNLKIPLWRIEILNEDTGGPTRVPAVYQYPSDKLTGESVSETLDVFVEWTTYDTSVSFDERLHLYQRIDNLARMLHSSSNRHPDLHTLDCLGYVEDNENSRYGLVYLCPPTSVRSDPPSKLMFQNLGTIISSRPTPELNIRFKLAHTLAVALWSCHSLDWLHKTLCPHNILFFNEAVEPATFSEHDSDSSQQTQLSKPYLAGFDSSRPDYLDEMTVASKNEVGQDLYRHPSSLGPFRLTYRKHFDIYSLGLLLLEIGLWKGLEVFHKGKFGRYKPEQFRDKVVQQLVPTLGPKAGSTYRDVVSKCLTFHTDETKGGGEAHLILQWIVTSLAELRV